MKANQYHQEKGRKQLKITMNLLDVGCYCIYLPTSINDAYELSAFEMWKKDDKRLSTNLFVIDGKFTKKPSWMHTHRGGMALTNGVNPLVLAIKNK